MPSSTDDGSPRSPRSGNRSFGSTTTVPPPSTAYTITIGSDADSGSHSLSRQRRSSTLSAKPRKHMQQIASSAHRNLVRCACGKPYGAAAAAAAAAPHEPPPPTDRSCAKGNGMKTNMQIRYTEPAISPIASGTCGPCTGRTSAPLASRFVSGLFRSIPKSRALMNAGRIASVNRDVTTYPRPESSTLTASGGGGQRWPGHSSDAAAPTAAVSTSASSCESGIGNSAAVSRAWRARQATVAAATAWRRRGPAWRRRGRRRSRGTPRRADVGRDLIDGALPREPHHHHHHLAI